MPGALQDPYASGVCTRCLECAGEAMRTFARLVQYSRLYLTVPSS